jgi:GntR family transcriptional regulator, transcriptional repressor for pyruvate dehydrogenase complex
MSAHETRHEMAEIRAPASYELVVDQVRRAIQVGRFLPGARLPPERELAGQLGVSRTTVREAMRVLQGERMVEIRRGRAGGPVVLGPTASPGEIRRALRRRLAELENVFDYRLAVEPAAAGLAAGRRTSNDLGHLKDALEALNTLAASPDDASEVSPPSRFFAADAEFHRRIALSTRNPLLVKAVEDARAAMFLPVGGVFPALHPSANEYHAEILAAIEGRDSDAARVAMDAHIERTRAALVELARPPRAAKQRRGSRSARSSGSAPSR